jgi:hypothetical protein
MAYNESANGLGTGSREAQNSASPDPARRKRIVATYGETRLRPCRELTSATKDAEITGFSDS